MQEIIAKDVVKSNLATTPRQAMTLARQVQMLSQDKSEITINFAGITTITAVFANRLLEQLHELFGDEVWQYVKLDLASLASHQRELLELVVAGSGQKLTEDEIGSEVDWVVCLTRKKVQASDFNQGSSPKISIISRKEVT